MEKVIVLFSGYSSASPLRINAAARNTCEIFFLVDENNLLTDEDFKYLMKKTIKIDFRDTQKLIEIVNRIQPDGITTFCEEALEVQSTLTDRFNLKGNTKTCISNIVDKYNQRYYLNMDEELYVPYRKLDIEEISKLIDSDFPLIVKPRRGFGSKEVIKINSMEELKIFYEEIDNVGRFYAEQFLIGESLFPNELIGDYVSVETISNLGKHEVIAITMKTAQENDFSETGMFIYEMNNKKLYQAIKKSTIKALEALSFQNGITHTEIKLTKAGPKIIEVNARLGGYVSDLVKRKFHVDLINVTLQISFKDCLEFEKKTEEGLFYQKYIIPKIDEDLYLNDVLNVTREDLTKISQFLVYEPVKKTGTLLKSDERTQRIVGIIYGQCHNVETFLNEIMMINNSVKILMEESAIG